MRYLIVGFGNIGKKRKSVLKDKCIYTVDKYNDDSDFKDYKDVPINSFDSVVISTPNEIKLSLIKYMLKKGKHVLIEKPFPLVDKNDDLLNEINLLSKSNNSIFYTSYNHRFEPSIIKLKKMLKKNILGKIYFSKFLYGNGTVKNSKNSWRDKGFGVIEDLGSHLIDLSYYLFPGLNFNFELISKNGFELESLDYCSFYDKNYFFAYECSFLMWKNTFSINIFGELGSLHLNGLNKWGKSSLVFRERIFPSGIPKEKIFEYEGDDNSWKLDIKNFEEKILKNETSYENDLNIENHIKKIFNG